MRKLLLVLVLLMFSSVAFGAGYQSPDTFKNAPRTLESPASHDFAITPHDTDVFAKIPRGIYIGGGGDLTVILWDSTAAVTYTAVPQGIVFPVRAKTVLATGTTATGLVGMY